MTNTILLAINTLLELSLSIQKIAQLIHTAQSENRDLTPEELAQIESDYEGSFKALRDAIAEKENEKVI